VSDEELALVLDANGTMLRVQKVEKLTPHPFTTLGWNVPDIAATIDALVKGGVTFERYGFMEQDERGVWTAPGGAKIAWFKDPDGNTLSLAEM
jgi:predicted enzyme related to lactoylglutathione lyase